MAAAAVGQIYLTTFRGRIANQEIMNTYIHRLDVLGAPATTDQVIAEFNTRITAGGGLFNTFISAVPPEYLCLERWFQVVWPTRIRKNVVVSNLPGSWAGVNDSPNVAVSIERFAETSGRNSVGRVQLPASMAPADIAGGVISGAGYKAALDAHAVQMKTAVTTVPTGHVLSPVLWAKATAATFRPVIGSVRQETVRVMRRRTVGLGI